MHRPYIARGLDRQGRHPEAAHAATDLGTDDPDGLNAARGLVRALIWSLCVWFVGAVALVAVLWP